MHEKKQQPLSPLDPDQKKSALFEHNEHPQWFTEKEEEEETKSNVTSSPLATGTPIQMATTPPAALDRSSSSSSKDKKPEEKQSCFQDPDSTIAKYFGDQLRQWQQNQCKERKLLHLRPCEQHTPTVQRLSIGSRWKKLSRRVQAERLKITTNHDRNEHVDGKKKEEIMRVVRAWLLDDLSALIADVQRPDIVMLADRILCAFLMHHPVQVDNVQKIAAASFIIACNALYVWYDILQFSSLFPTSQLLDTVADICSFLLV